MIDNVVPFRGGLSRAAAERRIRELAADTAALNFPWHVAKEMAAAEITMRQVIDTLRHGAVSEIPDKNEHGDWICVVRRRTGGRNVHVILALAQAGALTVVAVR